MRVKGVRYEDFTNYKVPSMYIAMPKCSFKCCEELGMNVCQNMDIVKEPTIKIDDDELIKRYLDNPISQAIVFSGLEPFDSFDDLRTFIGKLRWDYNCFDPIVIYTGYYPEEISDKLMILSKFSGIIIKFGRYIPNQKPHYDELLGVELANDEQYSVEL